MIEKIKGKYPEKIIKYGKELKAIGIGNYPYDCICKDIYPKAMIYKNSTGGWMPAINS